MHAVLARSQVRQLGGSGGSRYRFVDFDVPDTTTRNWWRQAVLKPSLPGDPCWPCEGGVIDLSEPAKTVFAPSAVVDAGAVAAFAALAAMPSDPDARSVAAARVRNGVDPALEGHCDSVV